MSEVAFIPFIHDRLFRLDTELLLTLTLELNLALHIF